MIASLDFGDLNITSQEDDILDEDEALAGNSCIKGLKPHILASKWVISLAS